MNKFDSILKRHGILVEQPTPTDTPAGAVPDATATAIPPASPAEPAEPTIDNQQMPEAKAKKLSPESFVWLVTVLKNAFLAHPALEDQKIVSELKGPDGESIEEINTENAQEVLDAIWPVISKYMPSELKTNDLADKNLAKLLQRS